MDLIKPEVKRIMEECKEKAVSAGLRIQGETLEYIISNRDLLELNPKSMIPTLYNYWVHDVENIRGNNIYDAFPHNPYETVINTRPAISFYNDNNSTWFNTMIFYHVLGHIDFFHNNIFFRKTWEDDFCGQALADSRLLNRIREERGAEKRWVDYVLEFALSIDNLVGYYAELEATDKTQSDTLGSFSQKVNFYFGEFLRKHYDDKSDVVVPMKFYYDEVDRYNASIREAGERVGELTFFDDPIFKSRFPEFTSAYKKYQEKKKPKSKDLLQHLIENSEFINKEENIWMKDVLDIVRRTSLYFQPQIRTKIANEGWASLWHERLFIEDDRMKTHETNFAVVNAGVMAIPKVGLNPYPVGKLLFEFIEDLAAKGKMSPEYQLVEDSETRKRYDKKLGADYGREALFRARSNFDDALLINFLSDKDFQDFVDRNRLFVGGQRINPQKMTVETYIKSKSGKEYRKFLNRRLYHPPHIKLDFEKAKAGELYLDHVFEGRSLVTHFIPGVLMGISYLADSTVKLETTEFKLPTTESTFQIRYLQAYNANSKPAKLRRERVLYTYKDKELNRQVLSSLEVEDE